MNVLRSKASAREVVGHGPGGSRRGLFESSQADSR